MQWGAAWFTCIYKLHSSLTTQNDVSADWTKVRLEHTTGVNNSTNSYEVDVVVPKAAPMSLFQLRPTKTSKKELFCLTVVG